jgi:hypothetical protein
LSIAAIATGALCCAAALQTGLGQEQALATRKPARLAAVGLAAALLAAPTGVEAKAGCDLIDAMLAKRDSWLKGVGVAVGSKGRLDVTLGGKPALLRDASSCDLGSPQSGFDLGCDWDYPKGEDEAAARDFAKLVGRLNACLPTPLAAVAPVTYSEARIEEFRAQYGPSFVEYLRTNKDLGQFDGDYPVDADENVSLHVGLSLDRDERNGSLEISVSFSRY